MLTADLAALIAASLLAVAPRTPELDRLSFAEAEARARRNGFDTVRLVRTRQGGTPGAALLPPILPAL